jgi:hypothetical protein
MTGLTSQGFPKIPGMRAVGFEDGGAVVGRIVPVVETADDRRIGP